MAESKWVGEELYHYEGHGSCGKSRKRTRLNGEVYYEHFGSGGSRIGESRLRTGILSDEPYYEHYDTHGSMIGTSRLNRGRLNGDSVDHFDANGDLTGTSYILRDVMGSDYIETVDPDGLIPWKGCSAAALLGLTARADTAIQNHFGAAPEETPSDSSSGGSLATWFMIAAMILVGWLLYKLFHILTRDYDLSYSVFRSAVSFGLVPVAALLYWLVSIPQKDGSSADARHLHRRLYLTSLSPSLVLDLAFLCYTHFALLEAEAGAMFVLYALTWVVRLIYSFAEASLLRQYRAAGGRAEKTKGMNIVTNVLFFIVTLSMELMGSIGQGIGFGMTLLVTVVLCGVNALFLLISDLPYRRAARK